MYIYIPMALVKLLQSQTYIYFYRGSKIWKGSIMLTDGLHQSWGILNILLILTGNP
jgi:hypothetical protein